MRRSTCQLLHIGNFTAAFCSPRVSKTFANSSLLRSQLLKADHFSTEKPGDDLRQLRKKFFTILRQLDNFENRLASSESPQEFSPVDLNKHSINYARDSLAARVLGSLFRYRIASPDWSPGEAEGETKDFAKTILFKHIPLLQDHELNIRCRDEEVERLEYLQQLRSCLQFIAEDFPDEDVDLAEIDPLVSFSHFIGSWSYLRDSARLLEEFMGDCRDSRRSYKEPPNVPQSHVWWFDQKQPFHKEATTFYFDFLRGIGPYNDGRLPLIRSPPEINVARENFFEALRNLDGIEYWRPFVEEQNKNLASSTSLYRKMRAESACNILLALQEYRTRSTIWDAVEFAYSHQIRDYVHISSCNTTEYLEVFLTQHCDLLVDGVMDGAQLFYRDDTPTSKNNTKKLLAGLHFLTKDFPKMADFERRLNEFPLHQHSSSSGAKADIAEPSEVLNDKRLEARRRMCELLRGFDAFERFQTNSHGARRADDVKKWRSAVIAYGTKMARECGITPYEIDRADMAWRLFRSIFDFRMLISDWDEIDPLNEYDSNKFLIAAIDKNLVSLSLGLMEGSEDWELRTARTCQEVLSALQFLLDEFPELRRHDDSDSDLEWDLQDHSPKENGTLGALVLYLQEMLSYYETDDCIQATCAERRPNVPRTHTWWDVIPPYS